MKNLVSVSLKRTGLAALALAALSLMAVSCDTPTSAKVSSGSSSTTATTTDTPTAVATANVVAEYLFDGNVNDSSSAGKNATVAGSNTSVTYTTSSHKGKAITLNNTALNTQYLTLPDNLVGKVFSVSLWANVSSIVDWGGLFHLQELAADGTTNQGWLSLMVKDARFRDDLTAAWNDTGAYTAQSTGVWHHYVATMDASGVGSFYVDGALVGTASTSWTAFGGKTATFTVGQDPWAVQAGDYDHLIIWNKALTATEVASVYAE